MKIFIILFSLVTGIFPQTSEGNFSSFLEVMYLHSQLSLQGAACWFFSIFNATAVIIWMSLLTLPYNL